MLNQFSEGAAKTFFSAKKMDSCDAADVALCAGFRSPALWSYPRADAGGDRKAPRHEIAVGDVRRCREHYGDLVAAAGLMSLD